jgi:hypothetical protein
MSSLQGEVDHRVRRDVRHVLETYPSAYERGPDAAYTDGLETAEGYEHTSKRYAVRAAGRKMDGQERERCGDSLVHGDSVHWFVDCRESVELRGQRLKYLLSVEMDVSDVVVVEEPEWKRHQALEQQIGLHRVV